MKTKQNILAERAPQSVLKATGYKFVSLMRPQFPLTYNAASCYPISYIQKGCVPSIVHPAVLGGAATCSEGVVNCFLRAPQAVRLFCNCSCHAAQASEGILQNLRNKWPPHPVYHPSRVQREASVPPRGCKVVSALNEIWGLPYMTSTDLLDLLTPCPGCGHTVCPQICCFS